VPSTSYLYVRVHTYIHTSSRGQRNPHSMYPTINNEDAQDNLSFSIEMKMTVFLALELTRFRRPEPRQTCSAKLWAFEQIVLSVKEAEPMINEEILCTLDRFF
jgi:hypothetical protein